MIGMEGREWGLLVDRGCKYEWGWGFKADNLICARSLARGASGLHSVNPTGFCSNKLTAVVDVALAAFSQQLMTLMKVVA